MEVVLAIAVRRRCVPGGRRYVGGERYRLAGHLGYTLGLKLQDGFQCS